MSSNISTPNKLLFIRSIVRVNSWSQYVYSSEALAKVVTAVKIRPGESAEGMTGVQWFGGHDNAVPTLQG